MVFWGRKDAILSASTGVCLRRGVGAAGARNGGDQETREGWAGIGFGEHAMSRGRASPNGLCNACEMRRGRQRRFGGMVAATCLVACMYWRVFGRALQWTSRQRLKTLPRACRSQTLILLRAAF